MRLPDKPTGMRATNGTWRPRIRFSEVGTPLVEHRVQRGVRHHAFSDCPVARRGFLRALEGIAADCLEVDVDRLVGFDWSPRLGRLIKVDGSQAAAAEVAAVLMSRRTSPTRPSSPGQTTSTGTPIVLVAGSAEPAPLADWVERRLTSCKRLVAFTSIERLPQAPSRKKPAPTSCPPRFGENPRSHHRVSNIDRANCPILDVSMSALDL